MPLEHPTAPSDFTVANVDLEHHTKFIGTTADGKVPSPVEMVQAGKLPTHYLDRFGADSTFWQEIKAYKAEIAAQK